MSMMWKHYLLSGTVWTLAAPVALALDSAALKCAAVTDNAMRLACYDKVYAAQLPPVSP